jgi:hypothetical protein
MKQNYCRFCAFLYIYTYARVASKSSSILITSFEETVSVCNVLMSLLQWVTKYVLLCN